MNATVNAPLYDKVTVTQLLAFNRRRAQLKNCLPSPVAACDGYVTFFDPGWSILRLREVVTLKGTIFYPQGWYDNEAFAKFEEEPRYRQLRMAAVAGSLRKTFAEQQALLPPDREIPTARVVLMGMVIYFLTTRDRLCRNCYVRCIDQVSDSHRVFVGEFDRDGLGVFDSRDDVRHSDLGLASSRLF